MKERFSEMIEQEKRLRDKLDDLQRQMAKNAISEGYEQALEVFSEKYRAGIEETLKDRVETKKLIHELIEEIVVYSRPVEESDRIAGKRKKDQKIPFRLHIKLKLPQDILHELSMKEFVVETSHLSG